MSDNWGHKPGESMKMDQSDQQSALCKLSDIGVAGKEVRVNTDAGVHWLMIFHREDRLTAWQNACPHQGRALNWAPDKFLFSEEGLLVCCHHGATFDLANGRCSDGPCKGAQLKAVEVVVNDGEVFLKVNQ